MASPFQLPVWAAVLLLFAAFLRSSATLPTPSPGKGAPDVLDSDGDALTPKGAYKIHPVSPAGVLGVSLALSPNLSRHHHGECPDVVGLTEPGGAFNAILVKFVPDPSDSPTIRTEVLNHMGFSVVSRCLHDTLWTVRPSLGSGSVSYIVPGYTDKDGYLVISWFKLHEAKTSAGKSKSYTLSVCELGRKCLTVGILENGSQKYLVASTKRYKDFRFTFEKYRG